MKVSQLKKLIREAVKSVLLETEIKIGSKVKHIPSGDVFTVDKINPTYYLAKNVNGWRQVRIQKSDVEPYIEPSNKLSEKDQIAAVEKNSLSIQYIKNPSEAVQLAAVKRDGPAIQFIKNPSEKVQLAAIKEDPKSIKYIKNPSEKVQLVAVKEKPMGPWAIEYIKNPSEAVQLAAVEQVGGSIQYIKNPSEAVQLAAVRKNSYLIQFIKNPTEKVKQLAKSKWSADDEAQDYHTFGKHKI